MRVTSKHSPPPGPPFNILQKESTLPSLPPFDLPGISLSSYCNDNNLHNFLPRTNLQALINALNTPRLSFSQITLVISKRKAAYGLTRASLAVPPFPHPTNLLNAPFSSPFASTSGTNIIRPLAFQPKCLIPPLRRCRCRISVRQRARGYFLVASASGVFHKENVQARRILT